MVGYLQSIEMTPARTGVNNAAHAEGIAALEVLHQAGETSGVLGHQLARSFPVTPFALTHVWGDGRTGLGPTSGAANRGAVSSLEAAPGTPPRPRTPRSPKRAKRDMDVRAGQTRPPA